MIRAFGRSQAGLAGSFAEPSNLFAVIDFYGVLSHN